MTKRKLVPDLIEVATTVAGLRQIPCLLEVTDDRRNRSFRDADRGRDVPEAGGRSAGDALAVVLYPIAKKQSEIGAVGYVTARLVECVFIMLGLLSLMTVVSLSQDPAGAAGADASSLITAGRSLTATYDWAFLFGPGLMAGVGNGLTLGYVMYRSRLMPRGLAMLGLVGGSLHIIGFLGVVLGAFDAGSRWQFLFSVGEMAWEAALPIYAIWKGFKPEGLASLDARAPTRGRDMAMA